MSEKVLNQAICLKKYISEKEYKEISQLEKLCSSKDKTNLKLELDYKLNMRRNSEIGLKNINEFLYYIDEVLVAYLGISSFGSNIGEINGITHLDWRRKGLFKKLLELAIEECQNRGFNKLLLLSDGESRSGVEFIKAFGGKYDFSEYRMKLLSKASSESINSISLRKAEKFDWKEIARQNALFFNDAEESESFPEEEEIVNQVTYMVELKKEIIGKIRVEYSDNSAFICGFGILPDFRGKGYGKSALKEALRLINGKNIYNIELDVECKNNTALNLYKACGFEEKSVMNYYKYSI
ncbi:GNAT family N-acetyltransferase [Clostridium pasteurianum]|uniref:Acetyltransferase n=1 Tax=Clostridium pasteurianum BC1 TaxID=86416 RepID=R4KCN5_CLOPA|nr:GNAT family N-acetyltransferase [Clostridium pasteurianum]AGK99441.1 acetyltransferase [Clostridium pasteurianum BC1]